MIRRTLLLARTTVLALFAVLVLASTAMAQATTPPSPGDFQKVVLAQGTHLGEVMELTMAPDRTFTVTVQANADTQAPTTTATTSPAEPDGQNGFYRSPVSFELATEAGASTEFSVDGGEFVPYVGQVRVAGDGEHTVRFRSTDAAGNVEADQTMTFEIDATAPTLDVTGVENGSWQGNAGLMRIRFSGQDGGAGMDGDVSATLDGEPLPSGRLLRLWEMDNGFHELVVTGTDMAGNETTETIRFVTSASFRDMDRLLRIWEAERRLDRSAARRLTNQLNMVRRFEARGRYQRASRELDRFMDLVDNDRWVDDPDIHSVLMRDAQDMQERVDLEWDRSSTERTPTVVNGDERGATIRFDVDGNAIDAHDGEIRRFGNRYYLYGTSYGCGYEWQRPGSPFCGFRSYSSPDLEHWTDEGPLFPAGGPLWQSRCNGATYGCYRPHVAYNPRTRRYVLWINSYDVPQGFHVFESRSPSGPFVERDVPEMAVNGDIPPGVNNGDHDLFVDEDGAAYLVYTDWRRGGDIVVERLDQRWLSGTGRHVRLGVTATEAPSLFERDGRYYITLSDPNCGYCTTGTSYFTAESPLGPWRGRSVPDSWRVEGGELLVEGGDFGLSRAGAEWTDYDLRFDATPLATADGGAYAQAGWLFRSSAPGTGYGWLLGNYPHAGAEGGNLTKVVFRGGGVVSATVVDLPFAIEPGHEYAIETRLRGDRIVTLIDGTVVDETVDATYASGRIGFRESNGDGESARFDDLRVTAPDGTVLLQDAFDGDLAAWDRPPPRQRGFLISPDSCGGQPADVAVLPGRRGDDQYLFQSDRWNNAAPNEALATHYWEPLRFDADGEILPLRCGAAFDVPVKTARLGRDRPPHHLDQTSGDEGFRAYTDIARNTGRAQTFTVGRTGRLTRVAITAHRTGRLTTPLTVRLAKLDASGRPGEVLAERTVDPADVSWSPTELALEPGVAVRRGERLAIVLVAPTTSQGAYGFVYSDGDPYERGEALYSADGGANWRAEGRRDLKFETSVR